MKKARKSFAKKFGNDDNINIEWIPVISVEETSPFCTKDYAFIGLEIDRLYIGKSPTGKLRSLRWCDFEAENELDRVRLSHDFYKFSEMVLPHHTDNRNERLIHYLAYNEPTWVAINQIREAVAQLKGRLRETLGSDDGIKRLEAFGSQMQKLLPPAQCH